MSENIDTPRQETNALSAAPDAAPGADERRLAAEENETPRHIDIKGHLNKSPSSYWSLAMVAISMRYVFEGVKDVYKKILEQRKNRASPSSALPEKGSLTPGRIFAQGTGLFMMGVTSFYACQTYRDIKSVFGKTLSWEFHKKPEDVNFFDFLRSKNTLVQAAKRNFLKYNLRRAGVNLFFFANLVPRLNKYIDAENAVQAGIAANSAYLMSDVLSRKETFFERLQDFVENKINHVNEAGQVITSEDLMNLYIRHARDQNHNYVPPRMDSPEWQNDQLLFSRIASLMNQTYGNEIPKEKADFTISKMIYMLGFGMIKSESLEKNLLYVEVANRYGMHAADEVSKALKDGGKVEEILKQYPVVLPIPERSAGRTDDKEPHSFADRIASEAAARPRIAPEKAASHVERAKMGGENAAGLPGVA